VRSLLFFLVVAGWSAGGFAGVLQGPPAGLRDRVPPPSIEAVGAVLIEVGSGQVLMAQDATARVAPASLAKLVTLRLAWQAMERSELSADEEVIVSERAWRTPGSRMFIEVGERVRVADLLRGIAIVSGNDACVALAEHLAGSEETFVALMNREADRLGLADTHFTDSHGIAGTAFTTAADVALLAYRYLLDHPEALALHSARRFTYSLSPRGEPITQFNRNGLLGKYEGADGLKTGFTREAGYHLVATAERDGMRLVAVVLGAAGETAREEQAIRLLDYGFGSFELWDVYGQLQPNLTARVWQGRDNRVGLEPGSTTLVAVPRRYAGGVEVVVHPREHLFAPVARGRHVADALVTLEGMELKRIPLLAAADVRRAGWWKVLVDYLRFGLLRALGRL